MTGMEAGRTTFEKAVPSGAAERSDQEKLFRICLQKSGIKVDDCTEDGDGNAGGDDRIHAGAEPDD